MTSEQHPGGVAGQIVGELVEARRLGHVSLEEVTGAEYMRAALAREAQNILGEAYQLYRGATETRDPHAADIASERLTILREVFIRLGLDMESGEGPTMLRFTTVDDVVFALQEADPAFELTDQQYRDIVHEHKTGRYEDITSDEFTEMLVAVYIAHDIPEKDARMIVEGT